MNTTARGHYHPNSQVSDKSLTLSTVGLELASVLEARERSKELARALYDMVGCELGDAFIDSLPDRGTIYEVNKLLQTEVDRLSAQLIAV